MLASLWSELSVCIKSLVFVRVLLLFVSLVLLLFIHKLLTQQPNISIFWCTCDYIELIGPSATSYHRLLYVCGPDVLDLLDCEA